MPADHPAAALKSSPSTGLLQPGQKRMNRMFSSSMRAVRSAHQVLADTRVLSQTPLRKAVGRLPEVMHSVVSAHFGWPVNDTAPPAVSSGGKAVRAALALLVCEAVSGDATAGMPAAVAVELVHNASLLHDDIIDKDRLRRGSPAVWVAHGVPAAILAGDALFFLGVRVLATAPGQLGRTGVNILTKALEELIGGECTDTLLEQRSAFGLEECEAMARSKTAALLAASCALGALAGEAGTQRTGHLRDFGTDLGMAFQLIDDLLGIWGDPQLIGKPTGSDLRSRKKSLPVAFALASGSDAAHELARLYSSDRSLSDQEVQLAAELVEAAGGRIWARRQAEYYAARALENLGKAEPNPAPASELAALTRLITSRDH
jgi:geranylgeranyl diphosphate synthase type I